MIKKSNKNENRKRRKKRVRVQGTSERPRLNVYRSTNNIYAQIIDDSKGFTLASASTLDNELKDKLKDLTKKEQAFVVGEELGKRAKKQKIKKIVFDRAGYIYAGRVKELAAGARKSGLEF